MSDIAALTREEIEQMDSAQRISMINDFRARINCKEKLEKVEIHNAIRLLRIERVARHNSPRARSKEPPPAVDLSEF